MIGVAVQPAERAAAAEFFELCKTPWEPWRPDVSYDVVIGTAGALPAAPAPLTLIFAGENTAFDAANNLVLNSRPGGATLVHGGRRLPVYGAAATFPASQVGLVREDVSQEPALFARRAGGETVVRIGYNLFEEIRFLLATGQPARNAGCPTLELHAALMRDLVTRAGLPLVEIPPVPAGHEFIACLTHDIDHPVLRNHRWDHTMFGFLYRATVGSLLNVCRGRRSPGSLWKNWAAALRLPFIHLGLARDFWSEFDRYVELEAGLGATYFVIPERDNPGKKADGSSAPKRASSYTMAELLPQLQRIMAAGNEVGLHGLDAWRDPADGRRERALVSQVTGTQELGVRMHWLYFGPGSPAALDAAGFTYDSTVGFNETVGYRAGTTQVYRPLGAVKLLELPLHVMDTSLFYPGYLELGEDEAFRLVCGLLDNAAHFGGVLTVNWHDRSIFPERLWGDFYVKLIGEMKNRGAWFPTAGHAVAWFTKRRQAALETVQVDATTLTVRGRLGENDPWPALRIRIHRPARRAAEEPLAGGEPATFLDVKFDKSTEQQINI